MSIRPIAILQAYQSKPQETLQRQSFCWFSDKIINVCNSLKYTLQRQQNDYYRVPHFVNLGVVKVTGSFKIKFFSPMKSVTLIMLEFLLNCSSKNYYKHSPLVEYGIPFKNFRLHVLYFESQLHYTSHFSE